MDLSPDTTVGELADAHPAALRVLERAGIDYCCGGRTSLRDACARAGVAVEDLAARITAAETQPGAPRDWRDAPLHDLLDHLETTHHTFTRSELDRACTLADKVARVHGDEHPELRELRDLVGELREELLPHLAKEERVLFPRLRALASPAGLAAHAMLAAPIQVMELEHERAGELLDRMRMVTFDYALPADACGSYRALFDSVIALEADLHVHMHLESDVLFARVR